MVWTDEVLSEGGAQDGEGAAGQTVLESAGHHCVGFPAGASRPGHCDGSQASPPPLPPRPQVTSCCVCVCVCVFT